VRVQNDLQQRVQSSAEFRIERREGSEDSLVHYFVFFAIIEHFLVPLVSFIPSILDDLHLPSFVEGSKNLHVIRVADTNQPDLALVLQLRKDFPRF